MKPFLKWAGGKYRIIGTIQDALPVGSRLIEPFVGSGAVFLNTAYQAVVAADSNPDLINMYKHIQSEGEDFVDYAKSLFSAENNTDAAFYQLRAELNSCSNTRRRAALFIYLNRHGFNGLCRYNSKGGFNVPFGRYSSPQFPSAEVQAFYAKSQGVHFALQDFRLTLEEAKFGDVVYCDPPYVPLTATANFSDYTQDGFGMKDQEELVKAAWSAAERGAVVVMSNHDTEVTRALYQGAEIRTFNVRRSISSKAETRGAAPEMLATFRL